MGIENITLLGEVEDLGLMVRGFLLDMACPGSIPLPEDFRTDGMYKDLSKKVPAAGVTDVIYRDGQLLLTVEPFVYQHEFHITGTGRAEGVEIDKAAAAKVQFKGMDDFCAVEENGIRYRIYEPDEKSPRPLILFLHGGGECGEDNWIQLAGTFGAVELAKRFSDMYVMAPQAPGGNTGMQEMFLIMKKRGNPFRVDLRTTPFSLKGERGWNRDYLSKVCGEIRRMIHEGKVDQERVYVIGMSMGGGGVLSTLSVDPDLFAAAVPICPSMNGESYAILNELPEVPTWISTAYIDHQPGRHVYLLEACQKLWREGRTDVHYTMFRPEELQSYGLGVTEGLTEKEIYEENHYSWILVLHNERCILDWMVSHVKKDITA